MRLAMTTGRSLVVGCGPAVTAGGGDEGGGEGGGGGGALDAGGARGDARPVIDGADAGPTEACDQMDILFVIDNSGSMGQEQANLGANFPQFISLLESFTNASGQLIDYHVGITTTGVSKSYSMQIPGLPPIPDGQDGEDGHLQVGSGCGMPRRWLERGDPGVSSAFSCAATVGTGGPSDEMPLEGLRLALTDRLTDGSNAGFLREDALLAVVILTDEEDCSRTDDNFTLGFAQDLCDAPSPVASYVAALDAIKGDRSRWAAAIIAGVGPGACSSELGDAQEASRLLNFAAQTGDNAVTASICEGDLATPLAQAMAVFQQACDEIVVD